MGGTVLTRTVRRFAEAVAGGVRDMVGAALELAEDSVGESAFRPRLRTLISIHYAGAIQGEFALSFEEPVAARLLGLDPPGTPEGLRELRPETMGFLKEALNVAVGASVPGLEEEFDTLAWGTPVVVHGEVEYPDVPCGRATLRGEAGEIDCLFALNLVGVLPGERLQTALQALGEAARQAAAAKRGMATLLRAFPLGLAAVGPDGRLRPGFGERTAEIVGLPPATSLAGLPVAELLGLPEAKRADFGLWLEVVHERYGRIPFRDLVGLCPMGEFENGRGLLLHLDWTDLPAEDGTLEGLLLIVEDVTEKRRLEREMRRLERVHDDGLELVGRVVNLEPDEIRAFLYDSEGLLEEARRIVRGARRDRAFLERLQRSVDALRDGSGQFQFHGLRRLALEIGRELEHLREQAEWDSGFDGDSEVERIEEELDDAERYVRRVEELRAKLGRGSETLKDKAGRSQPGLLVPLASIDTLAASLWGVHAAGRHLGWPESQLRLLSQAASDAAALREGDLARLVPGLESELERVGSAARLCVPAGGSLDIEVLRVLETVLPRLLRQGLAGAGTPDVRRALGKLDTLLVSLSCHREGDDLVVRLDDDGSGETPPGEILEHVERELREAGGSLRLDSAPGRGSAYAIRWPLLRARPSHRFRSGEGAG